MRSGAYRLVSMALCRLALAHGLVQSRTVLMVLLSFCLFLAASRCMHGRIRFHSAKFGTARRITQLADYRAQSNRRHKHGHRLPIYNENVVRVYEGLRATYELGLREPANLKFVRIFIWSDSTDPDKWVEGNDAGMI